MLRQKIYGSWHTTICFVSSTGFFAGKSIIFFEDFFMSIAFPHTRLHFCFTSPPKYLWPHKKYQEGMLAQEIICEVRQLIFYLCPLLFILLCGKKIDVLTWISHIKMILIHVLFFHYIFRISRNVTDIRDFPLHKRIIISSKGITFTSLFSLDPFLELNPRSKRAETYRHKLITSLIYNFYGFKPLNNTYFTGRPSADEQG